MDCIPPWLSSTNQCYLNISSKMYKEKKEIKEMILGDFVKPMATLKPTKAEKKCKNPCKKMTNTLSLLSEYADDEKGSTKIEFRFKETVKVEK